MQFTNLSVPPGSLPEAAGTSFIPPEKAYLQSLSIQWLLSAVIFLIIAAGLYMGVEKLHTGFFLVLALCAIILVHGIGWLLSFLSFQKRGYALREKDIQYRSGWLLQTVGVCPFNRVQHCSVSSGLIDRHYGLATLRIFTAGKEGDLSIPGLKEEDAFKIKSFVTGKTDTDAAPGENEKGSFSAI